MSVLNQTPLRRAGVVPIAFALALTAVPLAGQASQEIVETVAPGSHSIDGMALHHFTARWQERQNQSGEWVDASLVSEEVTIDEAQDHVTFVRTMDMGGWGFDVEVVMDRETLAPLRVSRQVHDVPEAVATQLAANGLTQRFEFEITGEGYRVQHTDFDGTTREESATLEKPVFDATPAGLIIAALPLEVGYQAKLPTMFVDAARGGVTFYDLIARVVGTENVESPDGGTVESFLVEVDWADPTTGVITSPGGADQSGGAYWITPDPPADFPYVPRYRNTSVDYILLPSAPTSH